MPVLKRSNETMVEMGYLEVPKSKLSRRLGCTWWMGNLKGYGHMKEVGMNEVEKIWYLMGNPILKAFYMG